MKLRGIMGAAIAAMFLILGAEGCSSSNDATDKPKCTPGAYVFCRCADRAEGTKLCNAEGSGFEECSTGGGQCVGGEDLTDEREGEPVDPPVTKEPEEAGPPGSPVDACPGKATSIAAGPDVVIDGDTTGTKDDAKGTGSCGGGAGGPDHVYHLQPTGTGQLSIKVQGEGALNPTIYIRTDCANETTQSGCAPPLGAQKLVQLQANVVSGRDYYLFVDGASGSAGKYKLTMKLTTGAICGDGKVDSNEACDDGNKVENDGCSNSCQQVNGDPTTGNGCATGHPVHMWPGRTVTGTGSTNPYGNAFTKTGSSCTVSASDLNAAQDHIYAVTPHANGNLKVTLTPEAAFNGMLVARATCTDPNSQSAAMCANLQSTGGVETMTFPVTKDKVVYVAAEGVLNAKGTYTIKFELP